MQITVSRINKNIIADKLEDIQNKYTKKREEIIKYIILNNFSTTGSFWWKVKTPLTRELAIYKLSQCTWDTYWSQFKCYSAHNHKNEILKNDDTIFLNKILNMLHSESIENFNLTLEEYCLIYGV